MTRRPSPIRASYWVVEGKLLAGEYPGAYSDDAARAKLSLFLDAGIRTFVDLTEPSEPLRSYDDPLTRLALERGITCKHLRFGIADRGVPGAELLAQVLATIRQEISEDRPVYVHCWGGIGRAGTIIGCWLTESGVSGEDAIAQLADLRRDSADRARPSPETDLQAAVHLRVEGQNGMTDHGAGAREDTHVQTREPRQPGQVKRRAFAWHGSA